MNNFFKHLLDELKTPFDNELVAPLKANRDANIAKLEAEVSAGSSTAETAVMGLITSEAKGPLAFAVPFVQPALHSFLTSATAAGATDIPKLYDEGIAWLEREEALL